MARARHPGSAVDTSKPSLGSGSSDRHSDVRPRRKWRHRRLLASSGQRRDEDSIRNPFSQFNSYICECKLTPKCRHDHRLKQHPRWHVDQLPDGTFQWTTPSGRQYSTEPTRYPV